MCEILSNAGFFSGLWAGLVSVFSLVWDIFFEATVYDRCQDSWWYDFGFLIGIFSFGWIGVYLSPSFFLIMFIAWVIAILFKAIVFGWMFIVAAVVIYIVLKLLNERKVK